MRAWLPIVSGLVSLILAASCTSNNGTPDGGTDTDGGSSDAPKDKQTIDTFVPSCEMAMMCEGASPDPKASCIVKFEASMVDVNGAPITTEKLFLCGTNICTPPLATDMQGKISEFVCSYFVRGAAKYVGDVRFASFASLAPMTANVTIPPLTLVALPMAGVDITATGTFTSNNVSLITTGATIVFDPSEPMDPNLHKFRAVQIPTGKFPPGTPANIEVAYGLGPVNAVIKPSAKLTVPNPMSWPQGTVVEFYLNSMNGFDAMPVVPYGGWGAIGLGKVDQGAATISTDPGVGNGIPMIGMVGLHHQ